MRTRINRNAVKVMSVNAEKVTIYTQQTKCMPKRKSINDLFKN